MNKIAKTISAGSYQKRLMGKMRLLDPRWRADYSARRLSEFVERCRERRLSITPQRLAIIRALLAAENHPSAEEICAVVRRKHPHVSLATVHRILEQFCQVGEARKVTLLHDFARYDGNVEPHHHVLCVRCRRVHDIEIPEVDKLLEGIPSLGQFALLRCSLEIDALCRRCQLAEKRMHAQRPRHTNLRSLDESEERRQS
ncbi:MAG: transcriptional repressor [Deltaproteobacteria bacterium]|nr:transcriptional repressor [Deltaproteobacteria bacterium]